MKAMAIRHEYESHGVGGFYKSRGGEYRNPHEPTVARTIEIAAREWRLDLLSVLDLAAGSGEATLALRDAGARHIDAVDPYTFEAYENRTGLSASRESFEQIAQGALAGRSYSIIVCSFALHLIELSRLPQVCMQLSLISPALLVLTPHKRPQIREDWGWTLDREMVVQRVRSRLYRSGNAG
jgi:hypothetical protein